MKSILLNILAVILGAVVGSMVNMAIVSLGPLVFPAPEGVDITSIEGLKASMHLFKPVNFLFPFLAHAVGTFVGAYLSTKISLHKKLIMAMLVSVLFLAGGIANVIMLPSPLWFTALDLLLAYLPMGYLAAKLAHGAGPQST